MYKRQELQNKINDTKMENKTLVEEIQQETVEKYEQIKNEVHPVSYTHLYVIVVAY